MCLKDSSKDVPGLSLNIEVMGTSDELNQQSQQKPGERDEIISAERLPAGPEAGRESGMA